MQIEGNYSIYTWIQPIQCQKEKKQGRGFAVRQLRPHWEIFRTKFLHEHNNVGLPIGVGHLSLSDKILCNRILCCNIRPYKVESIAQLQRYIENPLYIHPNNFFRLTHHHSRFARRIARKKYNYFLNTIW